MERDYDLFEKALDRSLSWFWTVVGHESAIRVLNEEACRPVDG
jgi:hypothetical protein